MLVEEIRKLLAAYGLDEPAIEAFMNDLESGCFIEVEPRGKGYEVPLDDTSTLTSEDARYSKYDVQMLMKRRVRRTHDSFFNRYQVKDLKELDKVVANGKKYDYLKGKYDQLIEEHEGCTCNSHVFNDESEEKSITHNSISDEDIVGLDSVKQKLKRIVTTMLKQRDDKAKNANTLCFFGNDGTGKGLCAEYLAQLLYKNELVSYPHARICMSTSLAYCGVRKVFDETAAGVLMIENFELLETDSDSWFYREYGKQTIAELCNQIEKYAGDIIVILSGNEKRINDILHDNPDLKARVNYQLRFANYTVDELMSIGDIYLQKRNYQITDDAKEQVTKTLNYLLTDGSFENANAIYKLYQGVFEFQADRTKDNKDDRMITIEDVKMFSHDSRIFRDFRVEKTDAHAMLDRLIGLEKVKKQVKRFRAFAQKHKEDFVKNNNLHMCFTGNPGTGKTEVGKIMAQILYEDGILSSNKLVFATRADLCAEYVGQTAPKVRKVVNSALGGVLFIDEAYALMTGYGSDYDYGAEAVAELVSLMEEHRGQFMVIFAGYKHETMKLIESNTGLKSRVNHFIDFETYNEDQLMQILDLMLTDANYTMDEDCKSKFRILLSKLKDQEDFGNARTVRNILEKLYEIQALNCNDDNCFNIKLKDIDMLVDEEYAELFKESKNYKFNLAEFEEYSKGFKLNKDIFSHIESNTVLVEKYESNRIIGEGTGFFINSDGLIVTNHHVIEKGIIKVKVTLKTSDNQKLQKEYDCDVVKSDKLHDLAIIKIKEPDISFGKMPLYFDDNYESLVRRKIYMGGYPLGGSRFKNITLNEGYIQSYNKDTKLREEERDLDWLFLETIGGFPGNSGSAVINELGQCVGIYSGAAIGRDECGVNRIRHAIPVKYLLELMKKE